MKKLAFSRPVACLLASLGLLSSGAVLAQTTDAYHSIQMFPVVVDTASFAQRFSFRNPNPFQISIQPTYFPAVGTSQPTSLLCPPFNVAAGKTLTITSLRSMCPTLPTGSQFGFLHTTLSGGGFNTYAAFSRVANPEGNGFTVEAFTAKQFTSADLVVNGLRRLAATSNAPAFQSNCFLGIINNLDPLANSNNTNVHYTIYDSNVSQIGQGDVALVPGKIVRLLDVFAAGGVVGDVDNAMIKFEEQGPDEPGVMAFCTVQDNTSFGADFRIAKQEVGDAGAAKPGTRIIGPQDNTNAREILVDKDVLGRPFQIAAGNSSNTHVIYLHHPDFAQCEIINPTTGLRALPSYGLEIRSVDTESLETGAGGDNSVVIPDPGKGQGTIAYLGDKADLGDAMDGPAIVEVESNEQNVGSVRPYKLHCFTGSGSTLMDLIRYQEAVDRF
ncbi:MAG: hypothetical protein NT117_00255 [Gammaproteobacteria bacterium]|nr:hypothetical protein [Gammaproteobacteria bacterium]